MGMGMGFPGMPTGVGGAAEETSNVIMVTNMPGAISDEQVRELVETFGEVGCRTSCDLLLESIQMNLLILLFLFF